MAMFSEGGVTSPDIWIVISIIIIALISVVLNPLVFRHNFYKKNSIARDLYMVLSTTDFLTSIFTTTFFSVGILSPKEDQCFKDHNETFCQINYYKYNRTATTAEKAAGSTGWSLGFTPIVIAAVLSITRWHQIKFPLRPLEKRTVWTILVTGISVSVAYFFWIMFKDSSQTVMSMAMQITMISENVNQIFSTMTVIGALVLTLASNIASVLTVWNIAKSPEIQGNVEIRARKTRGAVRILLLNAGNVVWSGLFVGIWLTNTDTEAHLIQMGTSSFLPTILSSYNPIVYVGLTKGILNKNNCN